MGPWDSQPGSPFTAAGGGGGLRPLPGEPGSGFAESGPDGSFVAAPDDGLLHWGVSVEPDFGSGDDGAGTAFDFSPGDGGSTPLPWRAAYRFANAAAGALSGWVAPGLGGGRYEAGLSFLVINAGAFALTLLHEKTTSLAPNRFHCWSGADLPLSPGGAALCSYDAVLARWRVLWSSPFTGACAGIPGVKLSALPSSGSPDSVIGVSAGCLVKVPVGDCGAGGAGGGGGGGGTGTVTSVGVSGPDFFIWSGGPITNSGTLTAVLASQGAGQVLASPASGGVPSFRALVAADIPVLPASLITSGQVGLTQGGTGADLSATGGAGKIVAQPVAGGPLAVVDPSAVGLETAAQALAQALTVASFRG